MRLMIFVIALLLSLPAVALDDCLTAPPGHEDDVVTFFGQLPDQPDGVFFNIAADGSWSVWRAREAVNAENADKPMCFLFGGLESMALR